MTLVARLLVYIRDIRKYKIHCFFSHLGGIFLYQSDGGIQMKP